MMYSKIALVVGLLATPALAVEKAHLCRVSAQIAGAAVEQRQDGAGRDAAVQAVTKGLGQDQADFEDAVSPIVDWVYSLPKDQLSPQVAESYEAACIAQ
jgi:hypothetical protein